MMGYIGPRYNFRLGVTDYPEGHIDVFSLQWNTEFLMAELDLDAKFVITNYFFDFVHCSRNTNITEPILPDVMPVYNIKMMKMLAGLRG